MTTSGTATFNPDMLDLVEEAYERAGLQMRSGYDLRTARRSLNFMMAEWANRGINMWTVEAGSQLLSYNTASYALAADTVDILDAAIRRGSGSTQNDIVIARIPEPTYLAIPNKTALGMPVQYYISRGQANPTIYVWPLPDQASTYTLVYYRLRRIQDFNTGVNTADVPFRFIPAMVSGLAYYLAMKRPEAANRMADLKAEYESQWQMAAEEDRDKSSFYLMPRIGYVGTM